jgi:hypothetical protein
MRKLVTRVYPEWRKEGGGLALKEGGGNACVRGESE